MAEKLQLKKLLYEKLKRITSEIDDINRNYDERYMRGEGEEINTALKYLNQQKRDIEELISVCVVRNKF